MYSTKNVSHYEIPSCGHHGSVSPSRISLISRDWSETTCFRMLVRTRDTVPRRIRPATCHRMCPSHPKIRIVREFSMGYLQIN